jgi:hypothetical protein
MELSKVLGASESLALWCFVWMIFYDWLLFCMLFVIDWLAWARRTMSDLVQFIKLGGWAG